MKRVTGIGGIFFKARDPKALGAWYRDRLGVPVGEDGTAMFHWRDHERPDEEGLTVWAPFEEKTSYFGPGPAPFMLNFRVDDLDAVLAALAAEGVTIDPKREDHDYGRFAWIVDPEGNRIELWEPPKKKP
jgi:catechol 2,3-dioxygenase-like lactoylglutathione lyase family enzyme